MRTDNNDKPLVSCILPVYNGERWLQAAIESVLGQTYPHLELIVINDGSTDRSGSIAADLAARDSRVVVIDQNNTGIVGALNAGLLAARGSYIARMDADDICLPERFARQVEALEAHPELAIIGTRSITVGAEGEIDSHVEAGRHESIPLFVKSSNVHNFPPSLLQVLHPTIMVRADLMKSIGGYGGRYPHVEDYDLYMRLSAYGPIAELQRELLLYRVHGDNVSIRRLREQEENAARCDIENVNAFRRKAGKPALRISDKTVLGWVEFRCFRREFPLGISKVGTLNSALSYTIQGAFRTSLNITALILMRCGLYYMKSFRIAATQLRKFRIQPKPLKS